MFTGIEERIESIESYFSLAGLFSQLFEGKVQEIGDVFWNRVLDVFQELSIIDLFLVAMIIEFIDGSDLLNRQEDADLVAE